VFAAQGHKLLSRAATVALVLSLGACSGGNGDSPKTDAAPPRPDDPGRALQAFVAAAAAGDAPRMWALLSTPSRALLGRDLERFRHRARQLEQSAGRAGGRGSELIFAERITSRWAVAAVERMHRKSSDAYAAALRLEHGRWRVEAADPLRIRPLRPDPAERLRRPRTQLAAEFKARDAISEAGLWLDGRAVPTRAGGLGPSYFTAYGESGTLEPGRHSVVAFASTARDARAVAWTFESPSLTGDA
jgi:hypothetical protein